MKKLLLPILSIGFLFASCDKEEDTVNQDQNGNVDVTKMYLPLKMVADDYTTNFTYNNKAQVTKVVESDGFEYAFSYTGDQLNKIVETERNAVTTYTFQQSGTNVTLNIKRVFNSQEYNGTVKLVVDSKGNLINDEDFTYSYDANGNIVKMTTEYGDEVDFTYDTKNGVFKNLNLPKWVVAYILDYKPNMTNNALSMIYESDEDPEDNMTSAIQYQYNNDNYPVKMVASSNQEGTFNQTIEYTKK